MNTLFFNKYILILLSVICGGMLVHAGQVHAATISASPQTMATSSCSSGLSCGLVGYWTFDGKDIDRGTNTMIDRSGNGNTAKLENMSTTTSSIAGTVGQALRFDGINDAVNAGSGSSLDDIQLQGGGGMTVSFWIRPTSNASKTIIGKAPAAGGTGRWSITKTSNTNPARLSFGKQGTTPFNKNYNSLLTIGIWQHIVLTWNGSMAASSGVLVYRNGVLQVQLTATDGSGSATSDAAGTLCIGGDPTSATPTICNGVGVNGDEDLDDVRIYNRIISTSEIQQLYNIGHVKRSTSPITTATSSCSTGLSCGLTGYWTFDGKNTNWTTNTATDLSGSGHNASFVRMSTTSSPIDGRIGQAIKTSGASGEYINYNVTAGSIMSNATGTMAIWMYTYTPVSGDNCRTNGSTNIAFGDDLTGSGGNIWIGYGTSGICVGIYTGGTNITMYTSSFPVNKWVHVVWVHQNGTLYYYINGQFVNSTAAGNAVTMTVGMTSGKGYGGTYNPAYVDDVRTYNRALSAAEIRQLYNIGAGTKQAVSPITTTSSCSTGLSCGLLGYWTFDGKDTPWTSATAATTLDKSGNENTMTLTNMNQSIATAAGKVGQGLKFDGVDDYLTKSSNIVGASATSICMWAYPTNSGVSKTLFVVRTGGGTNLQHLYMSSTGNKFFFYGNTSGGAEASSASSAWSLGKWVHVCVTRDVTGASTNFYVNGVRNGTANQDSGTPTSDAANTDVNFTSSLGMAGVMDDVRLYNRVLSANEIQQLYNQSK